MMNLALLMRRRGGGIDPYAISGLRPPLVLDFNNEVYRTNGSTSIFDAAMTHSRAGNATMVDSDGLLKWAPHNLLLRSEEFDNASWVKDTGGTASVAVVTSNAGTAPDGSTTADRIQCELNGGTTTTDRSALFQTVSGTHRATWAIWVKSNTGGNQQFAFGNNTSNAATYSVATATPEWQLFTLTETPVFGNLNFFIAARGGLKDGGTSDSLDLLVWGAHVYRSDLGGMVDNPDRGDSYVRTTSAARYLPRRGHHVYNGSAWVNEGVLHESEARTNLFAQSNNLAAWTNLNTTDTQDAATSPAGQTDANSLLETVTSGLHYITAPNVAYTSGTTYTLSAFVKANGRNKFSLTLPSGPFDSGNRSVVFDLSSETATPDGSGIGNIEKLNDGWYRCSSTQLAVSSSSGYGALILLTLDDGTATYTGDITKGIYIYGAQLEAGSTPSSCIPTAGATVTRLAETITVPAANLPWPTVAPLAVSIQMDGRMTYADEDVAAQLTFVRWRIDAVNNITIDMDTNGVPTGEMNFNQAALGITDSVLSGQTAYSPGVNVPFNIASRHGSTFINGAVDGVALTADTTPVALPDLSATDLNLGFDYMGTIRQLRMWATDLGDTGIAEAST